MYRKAAISPSRVLPILRTTTSSPLLPKRSSSSSSFSVVDSLILRSLKEHYLQVSKMNPPPKISPPSPFILVKGALNNHAPVLRRSYGHDGEEVTVSVMRVANILPAGIDNNNNGISQLFLHVDISKPGRESHLHFLCGLYPDALGIHSVSMRPQKVDSWFHQLPTKYQGPSFEDLDEKFKDAFHSYIEERGVNESLFPFLQAWLYVKDHRNLMRWFKTAGTFINERKTV